MTSSQKLTCKDAALLMSQSQDRPLNPAEHLKLQAHLAVCRACHAFQRQMDFLRSAFRRHPARSSEDDEAT